MKTYNKPAASKLVKRFDIELKELLMNDLKDFMTRNPFLARKLQDNEQTTLSVA